MPTCVITGASRGIGLELCRQLAARGDRVIAVCRNSTPELRALGCQIVDGVEVTDTAAIASLAKQLRGEHIDVLINNAGILAHDSLDNLDLDGIRRQFEVNALGPLRITHALLSGLQSGAKVVIITSRMGSIGDNGSGGYYGYRMSKAAVNMAGASLARDLGQRGITVLILHPGMVATDMTDRNGVPVADSAASLIARIDELGPEQSGSFHHANGEPLPW
jgi:NAD(P)-dependent dehydrogenase (short-subunit alcohol dehydrogenase family)